MKPWRNYIFITLGSLILLGTVYITHSFSSLENESRDISLGLDGLNLEPFRNGTVGDVTSKALDLNRYIDNYMEGTVSILPDGRTLRSFNIHAVNKEIEIAPGIFSPLGHIMVMFPVPRFVQPKESE